MPKDTKSSGYNKAPACESRGFGHKKEGENFDTPSSFFIRSSSLFYNHFVSGVTFDCYQYNADVAGIEKYSEFALRTPIICPKILDKVIILPEAFVTIT